MNPVRYEHYQEELKISYVDENYSQHIQREISTFLFQTIEQGAFDTTLGKGRREKEEYLLILNLARYIAVSVTLYRACQID